MYVFLREWARGMILLDIMQFDTMFQMEKMVKSKSEVYLNECAEYGKQIVYFFEPKDDGDE